MYKNLVIMMLIESALAGRWDFFLALAVHTQALSRVQDSFGANAPLVSMCTCAYASRTRMRCCNWVLSEFDSEIHVVL